MAVCVTCRALKMLWNGLCSLAPPARYCCLQLDFEGLEAGNADGGEDEEDDFEAQMRALEEGL